ncbi:MAG TPA: glycosyltransferase [Candidatus Udaeobacter sp.]|jgi:GT2 family glycosyltransferase
MSPQVLGQDIITNVAREAVTRPSVRSKFLFVGDRKFYVKGVTYGAFKPDETGNEYHDLEKIRRDFQQMSANGINTVRIPHTVPPRSLLDIAQSCGLRVMVGLSAEEYVGYLIDRKKKASDIEALIRQKVRSVAHHPALLCYALGNEIPASVVRWLGPRVIETYLKKIFSAIKAEDPEAIVTYVNYPTTEYLRLPFLDAVCFNVYLESQERLNSYLLRLQNIAGDRPLIMSEIGLDALRNGEEKQAESLAWQIRTAFAAGCAGAIVFSWTDEWFRGGEVVEDWAFGLTNAYRRPKPALASVEKTFRETPFCALQQMPRFSVIVCTYNGAKTLGDCLDGLARLEYPNYEVIVVNDGSRDATESVVLDYDVRLINTRNNVGLSAARNIGLAAADGEFIAYIDDDAYPDRNWLCYLANSFATTGHVAIGGPNVEPPDDGLVAACVANAPGGPVHVLLTDELAEHLPGCNIALRKSALEEIGGFDPRFTSAGDDVDVCWRLQERGWTLGFSPVAIVWHHARNSIRKYWQQQRGYGNAEALLDSKWPQRYNSVGHHTLKGRIYGKGFEHILRGRASIYHGIWGQAPFQFLYERYGGTLVSLPTMPEWYLIIGFLVIVSALGWSWPPFFAVLPGLILAIGLTTVQAWRAAARASFPIIDGRAFTQFKLRALTALLHLMQPLARLLGRIEHGLTFWRRRGDLGFAMPRAREFALWTEDWIELKMRLEQIEAFLRRQPAIVLRGSEFARWDLEVRGGMFGAARLIMAVEDSGAGAQYVRYRVWPRLRRAGLVAVVTSGLLFVATVLNGGWTAILISGLAFALFAVWTVFQAGAGMAAFARATEGFETRKA